MWNLKKKINEGTKQNRNRPLDTENNLVGKQGGRGTMKYYFAIKMNEILPFVTTWMHLEGIMLSEISQRKTNTI